MSSEQEHSAGLVVLSIDGGGIRGLSSLLILKEIMTRLQRELDLERMPEVHEHFDFVGGTGTGGVSAIMLGRMGMSINSAIEHFSKLAQNVFSDKKVLSTSGSGAFKSTRMQQALKGMIQDVTGDENTRMIDDPTRHTQCKTAVFAMSRHNLNAGLPRVFRSYQATTNQMPNCAIWEALTATTAHPELFKSIDINNGLVPESFVDGGLGCNNPLAHLLAEVRLVYPDQHVGCIVSIGAGHASTIHIPRFGLFRRLLPTTVIQTTKAIAMDSERVSQEMAVRFSDVKDLYFRFNVDQGMHSVDLGDWERLDEVIAHTRGYMQLPGVSNSIEQAAREVMSKRRVIPVAYIDGRARAAGNHRDVYKGIKNCPRLTPLFLGRDSAVKLAIVYLLSDPTHRKVFVIYGLGGVGKTQMALRIIETTFKHWSDIVYVDATTTGSIQSSLKEFAKLKCIGETPEDTLKWLVTGKRRWLLFFDNADDPKVNILQYLPECRQGCIMVTTRNPQLANLASGQDGYCKLSSMEQDEGLQLLLRCSRREGEILMEEERIAAKELLERFGHLPLAIVQAAGYISAKQCSFAQYRDLYLLQPEKLLSYAAIRIKLDQYERTVFDTWILSYTLLSFLAQRLLRVMAFMRRDRITMEVFRRAAKYAKGFLPVVALLPQEQEVYSDIQTFLGSFLDSYNNWDSGAFLDVIEEIVSYSLIEFDQTNSSYIVHPLVQAWAQTVASPTRPDFTHQHTAYILSASHNWSQGETDHEFCRLLQLHVASLFEHCASIHSDVVACLGSVWHLNGRWSMALPLYRQVAEVRIQRLGNENRYTLHAMSTLASIYCNQGQLKEAEELEIQVLSIRKRVLGEEHPDTLHALVSLANTYYLQGRLSEAKELEEQALEARKRLFGPEHPDTLTAMSNLAITYSELGRLKEAEGLKIQVLDARKRVLGEEHPDTLTAIRNLANTYFVRGYFKKAQELRSQVLDGRRRVLGEDHPDTLSAMTDLAISRCRQGHLGEGKNMFVQVLESSKRVLGEEHPDTLLATSNLAKVQLWRGRLGEARKLYSHMLETKRSVELQASRTVVPRLNRPLIGMANGSNYRPLLVYKMRRI